MSNVTLSPQCADILRELRAGPRTSLQLRTATGVLSLGPRMHELRVALDGMGLRIDTRLVAVRNRHRQACHVAEYTLHRQARAASRRPAAKGKGRGAGKARA